MCHANRSRLYVSVLTFLAAAGLYLAVPGQPEAAAATCNGSNTGTPSLTSSLFTKNKVCPNPHATMIVLFPSKDGTKSGHALDFFPFGP